MRQTLLRAKVNFPARHLAPKNQSTGTNVQNTDRLKNIRPAGARRPGDTRGCGSAGRAQGGRA
eukprot:2130150-Alexandrium_andersonii.AAC.1